MLKHEKENLLAGFKDEIKNASVVLLLEHASLPFDALDKARRAAGHSTKIMKVKNRIAKLAFEGTTYEPLNEHLKNERLLIISNDLLKACHSAKFFLDYANDNDMKGSIRISLGASKEGIFEQSAVIELSEIESAEQLRSRLLRVIQVVAENILRVVKAKCEKPA